MSVPPVEPLHVVVSGPPASGKSSLARALADTLGLPLLAKDTLKQGLATTLDPGDVTGSRELGRAAVAGLLALAAEAGSCVLDSVWHRSRAVDQLSALPGRVVEVFCRAEPDVLAARFAARTGTRGPGHFDADRTADELWNADTTLPVAGGWQVFEVDTTGAVDVAGLAARVRPSAAVLVRALWARFAAHDWAGARALLDDGFTSRWPASGERFTGADAFIAMNAAHPAPHWRIDRVEVLETVDGGAVARAFVPTEAALDVCLGRYTARDGRLVESVEYWVEHTPTTTPQWRREWTSPDVDS